MKKQRLPAAMLAIAILSSCASCAKRAPGANAPAATSQPAAQTALRDTHEVLSGTLWMQTSAEYDAAAAAIYAAAERGLDAALQNGSATAALEQEKLGGFRNLPPAVILDLDETVLDNSRFEGQLVLNRTTFSGPLWKEWVELADAGAIPGAMQFLAAARAKNVAIFFVTNRNEAEEPATLKNLAKLGIPATDENVLCSGENNWTRDKTARREFVSRTHRVVYLIGDDLNDFVAAAGKPLEERKNLVSANRHRWLTQWFLLPNPMYGSWETSLALGSNDAAALEKRRQLVKGFKPAP